MSKRIMVIDDEIDFTHMVKMLLQMSGPYQVREVHAARAAVASARDFQPDVILLDCMMPEIDGGEVASQLEADPETSHIPSNDFPNARLNWSRKFRARGRMSSRRSRSGGTRMGTTFSR